MPGSYASLLCHIVFSTKGRERFLHAGMRQRLYDYMGGILKRRACIAMAIGGTEDHIHLLVALGRDGSLAATVRDVKAHSSGWVRETYPELRGFSWQEGYAAFSIGVTQVARNRRCIHRQVAHHHERSFEDEFAAFLQRHGVGEELGRLLG